jgi:uncharacterized protein YdhG (YjbR/CyaY superfamily)
MRPYSSTGSQVFVALRRAAAAIKDRPAGSSILPRVTRSKPARAAGRGRRIAKTIDDYIDRSVPEVQPILRRIRATIAAAVPDAAETISYGIPAFKRDRIVVYFAASKGHIGLYPPVRGNTALEKAVAPYAGEKGTLRFPLDRRIPYGLIGRIAKFRARASA